MSTKQTTVVLLSILENLLRKTISHCDAQSFSLAQIDTYSRSPNESQLNLLRIFKQLYVSDCERSFKQQR